MVYRIDSGPIKPYSIETFPQTFSINASEAPEAFPWIPDGAQLFIDFAANRAYENDTIMNSVDAVSLTRAGSALMLGPDGYQAFPANTLARIDGIGAQVAPARVNKCTNYNAKPTDLTGLTKSGDAAATLTVVDDEAALRAAGFGRLIDEGKMNGKVFKLDNSAGSSNAYAVSSGPSGSTNTFAFSAYVRGSGDCRVGSSYTGAGTVSPVTLDYARRITITTAGSVNDTLAVQASPGSTVYFILNQLEEGPYASPPIITSGAAVSRPGDILSDSVPEITEYGVAGIFRFNAIAPEGNATFRLLSFSDGTDLNRLSLGRVTDGFINFGLANGSISPFIPSMTYKTGEQTVVFAVGTDFAAMRRVGETQLGGERTVTLPSGLNKVGILGGGNNTSTNQLGNAEDLTLWMGTAGKPVDQNFFDEVYAKATS